MCTELCPRYLLGYPIEPHKVMRSLQMTGKAKERVSLWAQYCCECNICTFIACPEGLDPKSICVDAKKLLKENNLSRTEEELESLFHPVHPSRQAREVPIATVYQRLGLKAYDRHAPFVENHFMPEQVNISLNYHVGTPAVPVVKTGDRVKKGRVIGIVPEDQLGCPVHASIDLSLIHISEPTRPY